MPALHEPVVPGVDERHTFVVPAHGRSPHLLDCLDSLRKQTRRSRIVIATATPFDGLAELAREYGARLAVNEAGGGIGADWNFARAQAATPWVTLAHQDDIYLPGFTEATMAAVDDAPSAVLVLTGYAELQGGLRRRPGALLSIKRLLLELGFLGRRSIARSAAKRRLLRFGCPIPCPAVTLRVTDPPLRFREDMKVNLDWEAWLRLSGTAGAFAYVRPVQMLHRIHSGSETSTGVRDGVRAAEDLMMFQSVWPAPVARALARMYALSYEAG